MTLAVRIRDLRLNAGLTQEQLAEKIGVKKQNISRYENGRVEPNIRTAKKIADALGVSLEEMASEVDGVVMATDKPRFTITLDPELLENVLKYKENNRLSTQSKAIQRLIEIGVRDAQQNAPAPAPALSPDEKQLVQDYRALNKDGREYIRQTMAMALQSWSGKNDSLPDMDAVK